MTFFRLFIHFNVHINCSSTHSIIHNLFLPLSFLFSLWNYMLESVFQAGQKQALFVYVLRNAEIFVGRFFRYNQWGNPYKKHYKPYLIIIVVEQDLFVQKKTLHFRKRTTYELDVKPEINLFIDVDHFFPNEDVGRPTEGISTSICQTMLTNSECKQTTTLYIETKGPGDRVNYTNA